MPPHQTWADGEEVFFQGPVIAATYGVPGSRNDVTSLIRALQATGVHHVSGGIHTKVGDPTPGLAKQFCVWYASRPDATFADGEPVIMHGEVAAATFGPHGTRIDVTKEVRALQAEGRNHICGGMQTAIGDTAPGEIKQFVVWYA